MTEAGLTSEAVGTTSSPDGAAAASTANAKRERPTSVQALFEYAYAEAGRRLGLSRKDVAALTVDERSLDEEVALVRRLAADDPFLTVPPGLLATVAELSVDGVLRRRVVDLVQVALSGHPLFAEQRGEPDDALSEPLAVTARDVSDGVNRLNAGVLGLADESEFKPAARERLRVNAVTTVGLVRVLNNDYGPERFAADMAALVWTAPYQRGPQAAALLAGAKNGEALGQLCRQFEVTLRDRQREVDEARVSAQHQHQRALAAEAAVEALTGQLAAAVARTEMLSAEVADLSRRLGAEQANRVVDKSHLVDDYEVLRTQVLRRLTKQVGLLSDGLHALQHGSPEVAEEFVDRALVSITAEISRLKDVDGGAS